MSTVPANITAAGAMLKCQTLQRDNCSGAIIQSSESIDIPHNDNINGAEQEGAGYLQATIQN